MSAVPGEHYKWVARVFPSQFCLGEYLATFGDIFGCHDLGVAGGDWGCCLTSCSAQDGPTPENEPTSEALLCASRCAGLLQVQKDGWRPRFHETCHNSPCS